MKKKKKKKNTLLLRQPKLKWCTLSDNITKIPSGRINSVVDLFLFGQIIWPTTREPGILGLTWHPSRSSRWLICWRSSLMMFSHWAKLVMDPQLTRVKILKHHRDAANRILSPWLSPGSSDRPPDRLFDMTCSKFFQILTIFIKIFFHKNTNYFLLFLFSF